MAYISSSFTQKSAQAQVYIVLRTTGRSLVLGNPSISFAAMTMDNPTSPYYSCIMQEENISLIKARESDIPTKIPGSYKEYIYRTDYNASYPCANFFDFNDPDGISHKYSCFLYFNTVGAAGSTNYVASKLTYPHSYDFVSDVGYKWATDTWGAYAHTNTFSITAHKSDSLMFCMELYSPIEYIRNYSDATISVTFEKIVTRESYIVTVGADDSGCIDYTTSNYLLPEFYDSTNGYLYLYIDNLSSTITVKCNGVLIGPNQTGTIPKVRWASFVSVTHA